VVPSLISRVALTFYDHRIVSARRNDPFKW